MAHQRPRGPRTVRPRAKLEWNRVADDTFTVVPANSKLVTTLLIPSGGTSFTVLRMRGVLSIVSDQGAAIETQQGAFGAVVITDQASTIGVTAIPGPVTDANADTWPLWLPFQQTNIQSISEQWPFDSKGKRKVPDGSQLAFIIENAAPVFGFSFALAISILTMRT